jgi:hypothetical protein
MIQGNNSLQTRLGYQLRVSDAVKPGVPFQIHLTKNLDV